MIDYKEGDVVVCINNSPIYDTQYNYELKNLSVGTVYTVKRFIVRLDIGVQLSEVECSNPSGWNASRFRKVYTPKAEFLESLLAGLPVKEEV